MQKHTLVADKLSLLPFERLEIIEKLIASSYSDDNNEVSILCADEFVVFREYDINRRQESVI